MRLAALLSCTLLAAGCTLISLDPLQGIGGGPVTGGGSEGGGDVGGGANVGAGSEGGGGDGGGGSTTGGGGSGGGVVVTPYLDCILADDPAIYFRMSGATVEENLGSIDEDATYRGGHSTVASLVTGETDQAATFEDANGNSLTLVDAASPIFSPTSSFSIEAWVRTPPAGAGTREILRFTDTMKHIDFDLEENISKNLYGFRLTIADGTSRVISQPLVLEPETVHHAVVMYDSTTTDVTLFVDGIDVMAADSGDTPVPDFVGDIVISADGFTGVLDEIAIYDKALTAADVQRHHAHGIGEKDCMLAE